MLARSSFGKLGNRGMARLEMAVEGGLVLPERRAQCRVENVSRTGCRLQMTDLPRVGSTVLIRIERVEALGTVAWIRNGRCGIKFSSPIPVESLSRLRWIADHSKEHDRNSLASATAVCR